MDSVECSSDLANTNLAHLILVMYRNWQFSLIFIYFVWVFKYLLNLNVLRMKHCEKSGFTGFAKIYSDHYYFVNQSYLQIACYIARLHVL